MFKLSQYPSHAMTLVKNMLNMVGPNTLHLVCVSACPTPVALQSCYDTSQWLCKVLPGGRILSTADETGLVAAVDIRMLGGTNLPHGSSREVQSSPRALLWRCRHEGGGITCLDSGIRAATGACVCTCLCACLCVYMWYFVRVILFQEAHHWMGAHTFVSCMYVILAFPTR